MKGELFGIPFWQIAHHEILHCLYSLLFLSVIFLWSLALCWQYGIDLEPLISLINGYSLLGLLVSLVLVSHYFADEVWTIKVLWKPL